MNGKQYPRIRPLDIPLMAGAVVFCVFLFWQAAAAGGDRLQVEIKTEQKTWLFPLDTDMEFQAPGPLGLTVIEIQERSVHVHSSPCPEKLCLFSGAISKPGQWIACLPNKVFITIKGEDKNDVDAYSF